MATYPSALPSFATYIDNIDDATAAAAANDSNIEIVAIATELGTLPKGPASDLKTRLALTLLESGLANIEVLAGDRTLLDADSSLQFFDGGASDRNVDGAAADASANHSYMIVNNGSTNNLILRNLAAATIATLLPGQIGMMLPTGTEWVAVNMSAGAAAAPLTTKGDLLVYTTVNARKAVGANNKFLKADSAQADGLLWDNVTLGRHTVWVPAEAMWATTTSGATLFPPQELAADQPEASGMEFLTAVENRVQFKLPFPKRWNGGVVRYQVKWLTQGTDTGDVIWSLKGVAIPDSGALATAFGTAIEVTDTAPGTDNDVMNAPESGDVTLAGSPSDGDYCHFQLAREGDDVNDDNTDSAVLLGVWVYWTTEAETDD
jgi:hypothetical protein